MEKRFVFTGKQQVELEEFSPEQAGDNDVVIKNEYTLMSTGTENIVYNRLFEEGTHWDNWVKYPFYPGYSAIGEIVSVGKDVDNVKVGDRVVHRGAHASVTVCEASGVCVVPDGIDSKDAIWFGLAKIAFNGACQADYSLGNTVLIIGCGPIGQMSVGWARAAGAATITVVDMVDMRLDIAKSRGADTAIDKPLSDELIDMVTDSSLGELPEIVVDTTGNAVVFQEALNFAAKFGTVIVLGDTGSPAQQHLSPAVITKGLTIRGAHDPHQFGKWSEDKIVQLFFTLVKTGRFSLEGMNTHEFKPEQAKEAYTVANEQRGSTMGIVFNWK